MNEIMKREREMKRGEFFQKKKSFRTLKPARGISPKCFEKKKNPRRTNYSSIFPSKVQNLAVSELFT